MNCQLKYTNYAILSINALKNQDTSSRYILKKFCHRDVYRITEEMNL